MGFSRSSCPKLMKKPLLNPYRIGHRPGSTRTMPAAAHQGGGEKYVTGISRDKLRARENIVIGTWNTRTLGQDRKIEELVHEVEKHRRNIKHRRTQDKTHTRRV